MHQAQRPDTYWNARRATSQTKGPFKLPKLCPTTLRTLSKFQEPTETTWPQTRTFQSQRRQDTISNQKPTSWKQERPLPTLLERAVAQSHQGSSTEAFVCLPLSYSQRGKLLPLCTRHFISGKPSLGRRSWSGRMDPSKGSLTPSLRAKGFFSRPLMTFRTT